ncbi:DUF4157 domain-containing protein, partial [Planctomycetota bacterium]|nr:DUF4157 domain-containing protein [Planctomycetota bacterium]
SKLGPDSEAVTKLELAFKEWLKAGDSPIHFLAPYFDPSVLRKAQNGPADRGRAEAEAQRVERTIAQAERSRMSQAPRRSPPPRNLARSLSPARGAMRSGYRAPKPGAGMPSQRGGAPLPPQARSRLEGYFGQDLGKVRVHKDSAADRSARNMGAQAYSLGNDIYFQRQFWRPGTAEGMGLLGHEVAHTLQTQGGLASGRQSRMSRGYGAQTSALEREADYHQHAISRWAGGSGGTVSLGQVESRLNWRGNGQQDGGRVNGIVRAAVDRAQRTLSDAAISVASRRLNTVDVDASIDLRNDDATSVERLASAIVSSVKSAARRQTLIKGGHQAMPLLKSFGEQLSGKDRGGMLAFGKNKEIDAIDQKYDAFFGQRVEWEQFEGVFAGAGNEMSAKVGRCDLLHSPSTFGKDIMGIYGTIMQGGKQVGFFKRKLEREESGAFKFINEETQIDSSAAGHGFTTGLYERQENFLTQLSEHSDTRTELHADLGVGRYLWAMHGFDFADTDRQKSAEARTKFQTAWSSFMGNHGTQLSAEELAYFRQPYHFAAYDDGRRVEHKVWDCPVCKKPMAQNRNGEVRCAWWCNTGGDDYENFWDPSNDTRIQPRKTLQVPLGKKFMLTGDDWYGVKHMNRASEGHKVANAYRSR